MVLDGCSALVIADLCGVQRQPRTPPDRLRAQVLAAVIVKHLPRMPVVWAGARLDIRSGPAHERAALEMVSLIIFQDELRARPRRRERQP